MANDANDALERTINYLKERLDVHVSQDAPPNTKQIGAYVLVARSGGWSNTFLDAPRFTVDCHDSTGEKAYALACSVRDVLLQMPEYDDKASEVEINSFYRDDWADGYPIYSLHVHTIFNV